MIDMENAKTLPPPYEIYDFEPRKPVYFKVTKWELGKVTIHPRWAGAPAYKEILAIRLYVDPETKPYFPPYYDITPKRLVYQLAGMLATNFPRGMWLRIERDIPGPKAHFSVSWVEAPT